MSASHPSSLASTTQPAGGAVRRFFREVWASYIAHSELRVMLATGRLTAEAEQALRQNERNRLR